MTDNNETMTDEQLREFLNCTPAQFEKLRANGEIDRYRPVLLKMRAVQLFDSGGGPRPQGVIMCPR